MTFEEYAQIEGVTEPRLLADGRVAFLHPLIFTCAICVGSLDDPHGYDDRWCYTDIDSARAALGRWDDSTPEPNGWIRHPGTGRRRPNGNALLEYVTL